MGNTAGKGSWSKKYSHPLFVKGEKAVEEGRYGNAELYFQQVLEAHPGRDFWRRLHKAVNPSLTIPSKLSQYASENTSMMKKQEYEEIELRLDNQTTHVLDFICLLMDIANLYLSCYSDKCSIGIARGYYDTANTFTREFMLLLVRWEFQHDSSLDSMFQENVSGENGEVVMASQEDAIRLVYLLKYTMRYYWVVSTLNYLLLCFQFTRWLSRNEKKRRERILQKCTELANAVHYSLSRVVAAMRFSETASVVNKNFPVPEFDLFADEEDDDEVTEGGTSCLPTQSRLKQSDNDFSLFTESTAKYGGLQSFLYQAGIINPAKIITDYSKHLPVRLRFDGYVSQKNLCCIPSPAERNSFEYISWFFADDVTMVPGNSMHFLRQELSAWFGLCSNSYADAVGVDATRHTGLHIQPKKNIVDVVQDIPNEVQQSDDIIKSSRKIDRKVRNKISNRVAVNKALNLKDLRTLEVLQLEEALLTQFPVMVILAQLLRNTGRSERAENFTKLVELSAKVMYGFNSPEYKFLVSFETIFATEF